MKIDKGVPMPPKEKAKRSAGNKYPFAIMDVTDSFRIDGDLKIKNTVCTSASQFGKRHNMKFAVRKEDKGWRIWRIR